MWHDWLTKIEKNLNMNQNIYMYMYIKKNKKQKKIKFRHACLIQRVKGLALGGVKKFDIFTFIFIYLHVLVNI